MEPPRIVAFRIKMFRIEASKKVLCMPFGYDLDSAEASLSLRAFCSLGIRKRRIRSSLCVAVSSPTRMSSQRFQLVASSSAIISRTSRSFIGIFFYRVKNGGFQTRVHLTCSPRCPGLRRRCSYGCLPQSSFPGDTSSWCSSDRRLLHTGALLRKALDPLRLGDCARRRSFNPADVLPSYPSSGWVVESCYIAFLG